MKQVLLTFLLVLVFSAVSIVDVPTIFVSDT